MDTQIKLNNCKCGEPQKLRRTEKWSGFRVDEISAYCPKRRWFNFWKHEKEVVHAWIPYPSVNKLKPEIEKHLPLPPKEKGDRR